MLGEHDNKLAVCKPVKCDTETKRVLRSKWPITSKWRIPQKVQTKSTETHKLKTTNNLSTLVMTIILQLTAPRWLH